MPPLHKKVSHTPPVLEDEPLSYMMPIINNPMIDEWVHKLFDSGNVSPDRVERVRDLACEANTQWKRKALVQRMIEEVHREHRFAVPIQEIFEVYGVHFTTETMRILEDGIQQSLRNFCRMLMDVLYTWDTEFSYRHDNAMLSRRVSLAVSHATSCLWGSVDTTDLCQATVHARLVRAVNGLWNTHAKPAIASEQHHLAEGIQRLRVVVYVCDEYSKPNTGGKAVPSKFSGLYARIQQRVIIALAWLLGNMPLVHSATEIAIVKSMLNAYKNGEQEARAYMDEHANTVGCLTKDTIQSLEIVYNHDTQWEGWHGVLIWGDDEDPPAEAVSSLIVQPPSYSSTYWTTSRVYCAVAPPRDGPRFPVRSQPVVRFCAMLTKLVQKRYLRLDIIGVDYLRLLSHADHARYLRNVNKIVEDELIPVGHFAGHDFEMAWFRDTRMTVVYNRPGPRMTDTALVLADEETGTDDKECMARREKKPTSSKVPIPEGVLLDHCLMGVVALLARSNVVGEHMGPHCNTFHVGTEDVESLVRNALGTGARAMTYMRLNQRLVCVFKMFGNALTAIGMQASFGTDKAHPRVKKLKVSWPMTQQHRATNLAKLSQLAEAVASHLQHGSDLPEGVEWNIPERSRRRRKARDTKCESELFIRHYRE
jgi:hypothetical protein